MGLIGYINDEIQRRSKEIAIRKVNGAEASSILRLSRRIYSGYPYRPFFLEGWEPGI